MSYPVVYIGLLLACALAALSGFQQLSGAQKRKLEYDAWAGLLPDLTWSYLVYSAGRSGVPKPPIKMGRLSNSGCGAEGCQQRKQNMKLMLSDQTKVTRTAASHTATALLLLLFWYNPSNGHCQGDKLLLDPFRKSFGHAKQWFKFMLFTIDSEVERVLEAADSESAAEMPVSQSSHIAKDNEEFSEPTIIARSTTGEPPSHSEATSLEDPVSAPECTPKKQKRSKKKGKTNPPEQTESTSIPLVPLYDRTTNTLGECARLLRSRCPACFGGKTFGRALEDGLDIHVAVDANFAHQHLRSCGDCEVDKASKHIDKVRKKPAKPRHPKLPDEAVDNCEQSHQAGNGTNVKTSMEHFNDGGLAALVCRHDIPLFFANVDTPGEQQKYAVALLGQLFSMIPRDTTVGVLYDVGCVMDRSLQLYNILPHDINTRIVWATSAMHAYAHQWSCQLVYNPRFITGFGLTDGEGVERLWLRLRKLIGICRGSLRGKRIWLIDRQASAIAEELKIDLGAWIRWWLGTKLEEHLQEARKGLEKCELKICDLREQWRLQREAQLSLRAHAPARLKKELNAILRLQMDNVEIVEEGYEKMRDHVEALYASLNVQDIFPELKNFKLKFVQQLLLLRDLKINIRKRAIGNMFEWDRLNQATGGRHQALGTKMHQHIWHTISKRTPALATAVQQFNRYCAELAAMHQPEWNIPLPVPLPAKLGDLRHDPGLLEDVWISPSNTEVPLWLSDCSVRDGIRGMLQEDRCLVERRHLGIEADNLCRYFGRELRALDSTIVSPGNILLRHVLLQRQETHLYLQTHWATPLATQPRFASHVTSSPLGSAPPFGLVWIAPSTPENFNQSTGLMSATGGNEDGGEDGEEDGEEDEAAFPDHDAGDALILDYVLDGNSDPCSPADEPTTGTQSSWAPVDQLSSDTTLLQDLQSQIVCNTPVPPFGISHVVYHRNTNRVAFQLGEAELRRLSSDAWLNDECINGIGPSFLQSSPFRSYFALFSSHDGDRRENFLKKCAQIQRQFTALSTSADVEGFFGLIGAVNNEDKNVHFLHCTPAAQGYFLDRLNVTNDAVIGQLRAHILHHKSLAYARRIPALAPLVPLPARSPQAPTIHGPSTTQPAAMSISTHAPIKHSSSAPLSNASTTSSSVKPEPCDGNNIPRASTKAQDEMTVLRAIAHSKLAAWFQPVGVTIGRTIKWSTMPATLVDAGVTVVDWGYSVPFFGEGRGGTKKSGGICDIGVDAMQDLIASFDGYNPPRLVSKKPAESYREFRAGSVKAFWAELEYVTLGGLTTTLFIVKQLTHFWF
ncbi:hypothetical protein FA15DRAFT_662016 [Coprinopsis marcescibilis]|uniref:Uncharacterized protein n=1 Tax=Coprinopsis marcescibilis TaxID=230819 RepID=A0A5C3K991_COPMA|nr:hypothetical protein FA15DRAFT_662016 [Coprinopsis marcescibilis]